MAIKASGEITIIDYNDILVSSTEPSNPSLNALWYSTTDDKLYRWDGTTWIAATSEAITASDTEPSSPTLNMLWLDTRDNKIYRWDGTTWVTSDLSMFATEDYVDLALQQRNKTWVDQPVPPYYVGDTWVVMTGADTGKIKTCLTTRVEGSYSADDWFTPLSAYTTIQTLSNVLGTDPTEFQTTSTSVVSRFNSVTNQLVSTERSIASLEVKASEIKMTFQKIGSGNYLPNSSAQNGLSGFKTQLIYYDYTNIIPTDPSAYQLWVPSTTVVDGGNTYTQDKVYKYEPVTGVWTWVDTTQTKAEVDALMDMSSYIEAIGEHAYVTDDMIVRDELVSTAAFKVTAPVVTDGRYSTHLMSNTFDAPKDSVINVSYKIYNNLQWANITVNGVLISKYSNNTSDLRDYKLREIGKTHNMDEMVSGFEIGNFLINRPNVEQLIEAYEYTTEPAVGTEGSFYLDTTYYPSVTLYRSNGTTWYDYNATLYDNNISVMGKRLDDETYKKIYTPYFIRAYNYKGLDRILTVPEEYSARQMYIDVVITPITVNSGSSAVPPITEQTAGNAFVYTGSDDGYFIYHGIYYYKEKRIKVSVIESSTVPVIDMTQVWRCTEDIYVDSILTYIKGFYYTYNSSNDTFEAIADSYIISQLNTDNYYKYIPDTWVRVPYNIEDLVTVDGDSFLPCSGYAYIGDIMVADGSDLSAWYPRSGENFWGKVIKFSGEDGITIYNPSTGYKRILNEYSDIAWKIDGAGNIQGVLWMLTSDGMRTNNVEVFGDLKLGYIMPGTEGTSQTDFTSIIEFQKTPTNDGIDEYFYTS